MRTGIDSFIGWLRRVAEWLSRFRGDHPGWVRLFSAVLFSATVSVIGVLYHWQFVEAFRLSLDIGWKFYLIPFLFIIWNLVASYGWKGLVDAFSGKSGIGIGKLYITRIEGQAVNTILPFSGVGSEVLRTARVSGTLGLGKSVGSVTIDKILDLFSGVVFALAGGLVFATGKMHASAAAAVMAVYGVLLVLLVFFLEPEWRFIVRHWLPRFVKNSNMLTGNGSGFGPALRRCFIAHYVEHILIALEIAVIGWFLGIRISIGNLLVLNALMTVSEFIFIMVPGKFGATECSLAFGFGILSLPVPAGLSIAIIRRARQLVVCILGLMFISIGKRHKKNMPAVPGVLSAKNMQAVPIAGELK